MNQHGRPFGWHSLTRRIIPAMRAAGHGRIVQNSSILGFIGMRMRGAYVASKHAIEMHYIITYTRSIL